MNNCKSCGTELNALNMSDIESGWCNKCVETKIEMINPIKEDPEFYGISNKDLNEMSRMLWSFPKTYDYPNKTLLADHHKPNPVDSKLDYIRKSLLDHESYIMMDKMLEHDIQKEKLEECLKSGEKYTDSAH